MKSIASFLVVSMLMSQSLFAGQARINHISCSNNGIGFGPGAVKVVFTGLNTFNITESNMFGIPLSQQAVIKNVDVSEDRSDITFELRGLITGMTYTLELHSESDEGTISTDVGETDLVCSSNVQILN